MKTVRKAVAIGLIGLASILSTANKPSLDKQFFASYKPLSEEDSGYRTIETWREIKRDMSPGNYTEEYDKENSWVKFDDFPIEGWESYMKDINQDWKPDVLEIRPSESYLNKLKTMYENEIEKRKEINGLDYNQEVIFEDIPLKGWRVFIEYNGEFNSNMRVFIPDKARKYLLERASEVLEKEKRNHH